MALPYVFTDTGNPPILSAQVNANFTAVYLGFFNVMTYGATGNGSTDDTTAIQDAVNAAAVNGGVVYFPIGQYKISSSIILASSVYLLGSNSLVGLTPANSALGSTIVPTAGFDAFLLPVTTSANFIGIEKLSFVNAGGGGYAAIRIGGCTGLVMRDVAIMFNSFAGGNGIVLDGGTGNILAALVENVSVVSGSGYKGGTGVQIGTSAVGTHIVNASKFSSVQCIGMTTGIDAQGGGGNLFLSTWLQSCTTAINFADVNTHHFIGGWFEANTSDVVFGSSSVKCSIEDARCAAAMAVTIQSGATAPRISNTNGFNPVGPFSPQPSVPATGVYFTNNLGADATFYIAGGTVQSIYVGSNSTGLVSGAFRVPVGQEIAINYTSIPTWLVVGD